jgi:putative membrane protein insertion efficiency factor
MKIFFQLISFVLIIPVKLYQYLISPWLPNSCRYTPSCSSYTIDALKVHGPVKGLYLGVRRILSCHQWGGHGHDPVPEKENFTWKKPDAQKKRKE